MKTKFLFSAILAISVLACNGNHRHQKTHTVMVPKAKIHEYKTHVQNSTASTDDDWIFWYILMSNNNGTSSNYYSYSSPSPVTNFSTIPFTKTNVLPAELKDVPEQSVQEVNPSDLPPEIAEQQDMFEQQQVTENEQGQEVGNESEGGNDEGGESGQGGNESSDESGDGGSDAGSSDGGSSDGGGDGGGGDGGGGGD